MSELREVVVDAYGQAHQRSWDRGDGAEAAAHLAGLDAAIRACIEALAAAAEASGTGDYSRFAYYGQDGPADLNREVATWLRAHLPTSDTEAS